MAQSNVYSLNVVGYVNYAFPASTIGGYVLLSNPLDNTNNDLNTIIPAAPAGTSVQTWNVALQDFDQAIPTFAAGKWTPNINIKPGQGFFVVPNGAFTNTFIGDVRQGSVTNVLAGNGNYEAIASTVPMGGSITNVLAQYPALSGDTIQIWNVALQDFDQTVPTFAGGKWTPDWNFAVGEGFFLVRNGPGVNYVRTFTVN